MSTLAQILTAGVALRRIGRVGFAFAITGYVFATSGIDWTPDRVIMAVVAPVCGAIIIGSIWVVSATLAFWLIGAQEVTGTVTHGTNLFISYPIEVYSGYLRRLFAFAIPGAFVSCYPALYLLDRPDPLGGSASLCWLSPPIAVLSAARVAQRAPVQEVALREPTIEELVRRLYSAGTWEPSDTVRLGS